MEGNEFDGEDNLLILIIRRGVTDTSLLENGENKRNQIDQSNSIEGPLLSQETEAIEQASNLDRKGFFEILLWDSGNIKSPQGSNTENGLEGTEP